MNYSAPLLVVPAWTPMPKQTRYPKTGTYDVSDFAYLGGVIGLNPQGDVSRGVITCFWTLDAAGSQIVGVSGWHLSSLIVSLDQLRRPNLGPYLFLTYETFRGSNPLAATLFGTNCGSPVPSWPGDTILISEAHQPLASNANVTWYPDDYFAGPVRLYLDAPAGVTLTLYGADLTDQFWPLDTLTAGSVTTITPMGTWFVVVSNATAEPITYSVSATPLLAGML